MQTLPMVQPAYELLGTALKKARHVKPTKGMSVLKPLKIASRISLPILFLGITNIAKRERNRGAKQLDALTKVLLKIHHLICSIS